MRSNALLTVAAAALMAAPAATAVWYAPGSYEPDTDFDADGDYMWLNTDTNPSLNHRKVYFTAYQTIYPTGVNPNSARVGDRIHATPTSYMVVLLGVWKDCNNDGGIGLLESAALTYRAEALTVRGICDPVQEDSSAPGFVPSHNDGQWVREFIPIGYNTTEEGEDEPRNPYFIDVGNQPGEHNVKVWADAGAPGRQPGFSCPVVPPPHGTTSGTGSMIRWLDCQANGQITGGVNSTLYAVDPEDCLDLCFPDGNNPQRSQSPLNRELPESLFGNPRTNETGAFEKDSGDPAFTTFDCSREETDNKHWLGVHQNGYAQTTNDDGTKSRTDVPEPVMDAIEDSELTGGRKLPDQIDDPTADPPGPGEKPAAFFTLSDDEGWYFWMAKPSPAVHDPAASFADGFNNTFDGYNVLDDTAKGSCGDRSSEDSAGNDYETAHELAFFYADGPVEGTAQAPGKNSADLLFSFNEGSPYEPTCTPAAAGPQQCVTTGNGTPTDGLYGVYPSGPFLRSPAWDADGAYLSPPQLVRDDNLQPSPRQYWTFYAYVRPANATQFHLELPPGEDYYGSANCATWGEGASNQKGWVCDPAGWNVDAQGNAIQDPTGISVRVGQTFNLRDVDCYDGQVARGVKVYASLVEQSSGPCEEV